MQSVARVPSAICVHPRQRSRWNRGPLTPSASDLSPECGTSFGKQTFLRSVVLVDVFCPVLREALSIVSQSGLVGWNLVKQVWEFLGSIGSLSQELPATLLYTGVY